MSMGDYQKILSGGGFVDRVRSDNGIALSAQEAPGLERLACDLNARVAAAAAEHLTLDAAPWSLASLWAGLAAEMKK